MIKWSYIVPNNRQKLEHAKHLSHHLSVLVVVAPLVVEVAALYRTGPADTSHTCPMLHYGQVVDDTPPAPVVSHGHHRESSADSRDSSQIPADILHEQIQHWHQQTISHNLIVSHLASRWKCTVITTVLQILLTNTHAYVPKQPSLNRVNVF